jgi:hypothetical protein
MQLQTLTAYELKVSILTGACFIHISKVTEVQNYAPGRGSVNIGVKNCSIRWQKQPVRSSIGSENIVGRGTAINIRLLASIYTNAI